MDQSLVHNLSPAKFVWTNGPESFSKVSPYTGIGPWMALPSGCGSSHWVAGSHGVARMSKVDMLDIHSSQKVLRN